MSEIIKHYASGYEEDRLKMGSGKLEFERTKELVRRFLPSPPAVILDIGGGTGPYSFWLAGLGYETHLLDVVPLHIELAKKAALEGSASVPAEAVVGDARSLPWEDEKADSALFLGPLYHLTAQKDRMTALREARRVLKPGGVLLTAGISRYASVLDGLRAGFLTDPAFAAIVDRDLADGQHRNPTGKPEYFTDAFFHRPDELRDEVAEAGFDVAGVFGIEGPGWLVPDFDSWWGDPERRERMLSIARRLEDEPGLAGISAHMLAVGRKI
jgi:ubiquinone/menaquinone biosynthesis C-methylase UbiE